MVATVQTLAERVEDLGEARRIAGVVLAHRPPGDRASDGPEGGSDEGGIDLRSGFVERFGIADHLGGRAAAPDRERLFAQLVPALHLGDPAFGKERRALAT